ncbi:MAG: LapA family protein [Nodularia sp. (in: Bacteria)]|nr:MAG: LapA family protein [Nodularia sp. (in: cyanobacteria)]
MITLYSQFNTDVSVLSSFDFCNCKSNNPKASHWSERSSSTMQIFSIIAVLVALLAVVFAFQNAVTISVTFFDLNFEASLAIVLILTVGIGILIGLLVSIPSVIQRNLRISKYKGKIVELENESNEQLETITHQRQRIENLEKHLNLKDNQ